MTLREFIEIYDNWNGYTCINDNNLYARVKTVQIDNGNYERALNAKVIAFGFYDDELCVRVDL